MSSTMESCQGQRVNVDSSASMPEVRTTVEQLTVPVINDTEYEDDPIAMFVGQLPRTVEEKELREMFEQFGPITHLKMIRDKATGEGKGCCFVTFAKRKDAMEAQASLHNVRKFPGLYRPVQMKPADNELETKLFVAMLPVDCDEEKLIEVFAPYGKVTDCTVLRNRATNQSKRCGFVNYISRAAALRAISNLHQVVRLDGAQNHLVVKFAETNSGSAEDKDTRRKSKTTIEYQKQSSSRVPEPRKSYNGSSNDSSVDDMVLIYQLLENYGIAVNGNLNLPRLMMILNSFSGRGDYESGPVMHLPSSYPESHSIEADIRDLLSRFDNPSRPEPPQQHQMDQSFPHNMQQQSQGELSDPKLVELLRQAVGRKRSNEFDFGSSMMRPAAQSFNSAMDPLAGLTKRFMSSSGSGHGNNPATVFGSNNSAHNDSSSKRGPSGCNVFVNFLPPHILDSELEQIFASFGDIISTKVLVDRATNKSRGFGFVSFCNPQSAQAAVSAMHGIQLAGKTLSVQLKTEH